MDCAQNPKPSNSQYNALLSELFRIELHYWFPFKDGSKNDREVTDLDDAASANQKRMNADPFEVMLMNMGYRITSVQGDEGDGGDEGAREAPAINCRPS